MEKTKLGISKVLFAAGAFVIAMAGGYIPSILIVLYVFLKEDDLWLKRMTLKALVLICAFGLVEIGLGLVPDALSAIESLAYGFNGSVNVKAPRELFEAIIVVFEIIEKVFLLILASKAMKQQTVRVPVVDELLDKYI